MSEGELADIYRKAWELYYTPQHVETVLRRTKTWGYDPHNMMWKLFSFHAPPLLERVHPLEGGIFRRKRRRDRRPDLPIESPLTFYPREGWKLLVKYARFAAMYWQYRRILRRVLADDQPYTDVATTPVQAQDVDVLQLYKNTRGSEHAVDKLRRRTKLRAAANGSAVGTPT
jgi:hypothetical protein